MGFHHPDYTIIKELGRGASGVVYLAVQKQLNRRVAVKVFTDPFAFQRSGEARGQSTGNSADRRFLREARILAQLDHPHIVPVYELSPLPDQQGYLLAMAYVDGGTLRLRSPELTVRQILTVMLQIADALNYAHESGFVHRDVKPDNILFQQNQAMLADFGIARAAESETRLTQHGAMLGTPEYMSPEQVNGDAVDGRSDLYSLGIVFYELLTGNPPFRADSAIATGIQHLTHEPADLPPVFAAFQPLMHRWLAKDKQQRPANALALISELERAAASMRWPLDETPGELRLHSVPPVSTAVTEARGKSAVSFIARVVAVGAVLSTIAVWFFWNRSVTRTIPATDVAISSIEEQRSDDAPSGETTVDAIASINTTITDNKTADSRSAESGSVSNSDVRADTNADLTDATDSESDSNPDSSTGSSTGNSTRNDTEKEAVADKLLQAEALWQQGKWFDGTVNAVTAYKALQGQDSVREDAAVVLEDIFTRTYAEAEQSIADGKPEDAASTLAKLKEHWPGDSRIRVLEGSIQSAVQRRQAAERKQRIAAQKTKRIEALLSRAREAERADRLLQPDDDSALFYYRQVLGEDPSNNRATSALVNLKDTVLQRVRQQVSLAKFDVAEAQIGLLNESYPDDPAIARELDSIRNQQRERDLQAVEAQRRVQEEQAIKEQLSSLQASVEAWIAEPLERALSNYEQIDNRIRELQLRSPQNASLDALRIRVSRHQQSLSAKKKEQSEQQLEDTFNMPGF